MRRSSARHSAGANLEPATLNGADATDADFIGAQMQDALMNGTNLTRARFSDENGQNTVRLLRIECENATFEDAHLRGVEMNGAQCAGSNFRGANMKETSIKRSLGVAG